MPNVLLLSGALFCCVIGFAWLALTLESHWRQIRSNQVLPKSIVSVLRIMGSMMLFVSLLLCLLADHPSMAVLVWVMTLAIAALMVAFTFTWKPRVFSPLVAWVGNKNV